MRLINTATLTLESFFDPVAVPYAILSHTWEKDGEVTFQDFLQPEIARNKPGFSKIEETCRKAVEAGLQYAWVDTCCIDKTSSAELSEAINSMFPWYRDATVCYVFLSDFVVGDSLQSLKRCRWFTRGWTLQELLAPSDVQFRDSSWNLLGTKATLCTLISDITDIKQDVLLRRRHIADITVAQRMSWASGRVTARVEDMAYCLIGIFSVNMPMLYGEGRMAFIRLQEEILKKTNDLSLLAWKARDDDTQKYRGILAHAPNEFDSCGDIEMIKDQIHFAQDFTLTNRGLKIKTSFNVDYKIYREERPISMPLGCMYGNDMESKYIGIKLLKVHGGLVRLYPRDLDLSETVNDRNFFVSDPDTYIATDVDARTSFSLGLEADHMITISKDFLPNYHIVVRYNHPGAFWDPARSAFITGGLDYFLGITRFGIIYDERERETVEFDAQTLEQNRQLATTDVFLLCAYSRSRMQIFCRLFSNIQDDGSLPFIEQFRYKDSAGLKFFVEKFFEDVPIIKSFSIPVEVVEGNGSSRIKLNASIVIEDGHYFKVHLSMLEDEPESVS